MGGGLSGMPTASWDFYADRLDVYAVGLDRNIWHDILNGTTWSGWALVTSGMQSGLSEVIEVTCDRGPDDKVDLFIRDVSGIAWHGKTDSTGGTVLQWESLSGTVKGAPFGVWDTGLGRLDVYAIGLNDRVYHDYKPSGGGWSGWSAAGPVQLAGQAETELVTGVRNTLDGTIDLFLRDASGQVLRSVTDTNGVPGSWVSLSGGVKGAPVGVRYFNVATLDVYAIGLDDSPYIRNWNGSQWGPWTKLSGGAS